MLPNDLRHLPRNDDPFQIISEAAAGTIILCLFALLLIFWPYVK